MKLNTLQCFHSVKRKPHCGLDGLASFSLAYTDRDSGDLVLRTYLPKQEGDLICIGPKKCTTDMTCNSWTEAKQHIYSVSNPGQWQSLPSGAIVGVRKRQVSSPPCCEPRNGHSSPGTSSLRRRGAASRSSPAPKSEDRDIWEAWMISAKGERHTIPLYSEAETHRLDHQLFVTSCGPITQVGRRSVALGFGNVIKVITVGNERFDTGDDSSEDVTLAMAGRRRRPVAPRPGTSAGCCAAVVDKRRSSASV